MLGRFALGLGLAAVTPDKPARRVAKPAGPVGVLAVIGAVAVMVYGNATHTWTVAWFLVIPLVCAAFIAAGWIQRSTGRTNAVNRAIAARAAQTPRVTTVAEMRERASQVARNRRVAALLLPACPMCGAITGQSCRPVAGITFYLLDKGRGLHAHSIRIQKAVATGAAVTGEVAAQFGGEVPAELCSVLTE